MFPQIESNRVDDMVPLSHLELQMVLPDDARGADDCDVPDGKNRTHVLRSERSELTQDPNEFRGDLTERDFGVDPNLRSENLLRQHFVRRLLEGIPELFDPVERDGQSGRVLVPAELNELVLDPFQRFVDVEPADASGRTFDNAVDCCHHDRRSVITLDEARCDDADDSRMPFVLVQNDRRVVRGKMVVHDLLCLREGHFVDLSPFGVLMLEHAGKFQRGSVRITGKQLHGAACVAETSDGINARGKDKHRLAGRDPSRMHAGDVDERLNARNGLSVEKLKADLDDRTILARKRNDVRRRRECDILEVLAKGVSLGVLKLGTELVDGRQCLNELERDARPAQRFIRIRAVLLDGVEYGNGGRRSVSRLVMVAHDNVDARRCCCGDLRPRSNATIDGDDQRRMKFFCPLQSRERQAVPFLLAVGDEVRNIRTDALEERPENGRPVCPINVVVAVDKDLLVRPDRA